MTWCLQQNVYSRATYSGSIYARIRQLGPDFRNVLWRTYEKLRMSMWWLSKNLTKILWKTSDELMQNLRKTYNDITDILQKKT